MSGRKEKEEEGARTMKTMKGWGGGRTEGGRRRGEEEEEEEGRTGTRHTGRKMKRSRWRGRRRK